MKVRVNDVLEPVTESSPIHGMVRVLFLDIENDVASLIGLQDPLRSPFDLTIDELSKSISAGAAFCKVVVASAVFFMPPFSVPVAPSLG